MLFRAPFRASFTVLLGMLALVPSARAQSALPYPAQEQGAQQRPLPAESDPTYVPPDEYPYEREDREERLSGIDDPGVGLYAEVLFAAMFVEASRGSLVDARFGIGARLTWDWGRILPSDLLRQALFLDIQYLSTSFREGTDEVFVDTRFHYLTIAPAYAFPFGDGSAYSFFLQAGAGVALTASPITVDGVVTNNGGLQPVIQYGLGIRGKPRVGGLESLLRLSFRFDVTRFHRGYADDTYIGGSIGLGF